MGTRRYCAPMDADYLVRVAAGTLRSDLRADLSMPHRWTAEGVVAEVAFTGAHLLHLAVAGCVLNDVYREAGLMGIEVDGVVVAAHGGFEATSWRSSGVHYQVQVHTAHGGEAVERLLARVDEVAEIPKALRAGAAVSRNR